MPTPARHKQVQGKRQLKQKREQVDLGGWFLREATVPRAAGAFVVFVACQYVCTQVLWRTFTERFETKPPDGVFLDSLLSAGRISKEGIRFTFAQLGDKGCSAVLREWMVVDTLLAVSGAMWAGLTMGLIAAMPPIRNLPWVRWGLAPVAVTCAALDIFENVLISAMCVYRSDAKSFNASSTLLPFVVALKLLAYACMVCGVLGLGAFRLWSDQNKKPSPE